MRGDDFKFTGAPGVIFVRVILGFLGGDFGDGNGSDVEDVCSQTLGVLWGYCSGVSVK